jgi:hypothetical protein
VGDKTQEGGGVKNFGEKNKIEDDWWEGNKNEKRLKKLNHVC